MSLLVVLCCAALSVVGSYWYFRRFAVTRPPFGVVNLYDVVAALIGLALLPHLYLKIPISVVVVIGALITLAALHATIEPLVRGALLWTVCVALIATDVATGLAFGVANEAFLAVNNAIVIITTIGVANLWAQTGLRASHLAMFAVALTCYDLFATWQLTVMLDLFIELTRMPLFPMAAWGLHDVNDTMMLGVGDLWIAALAPLVLRKAYGRTAGLVAVVAGLGTLAAVSVLLVSEVLGHTIPVMAFLGPVTVAQCLYWRHARDRERSTRQYLLAEPLPRRTMPPVVLGGR
jgi:hypothetical protein